MGPGRPPIRHPVRMTDGPTTASVILIRYGWGLYQKKKTHPYGWYMCLETPHPSSGPDGIGKWAQVSVDGQDTPLPQKRMGPLCNLCCFMIETRLIDEGLFIVVYIKSRK
jgi:hypothetical protein